MRSLGLAWVVLGTGLLSVVVALAGAFSVVHVGGGPSGWCMKGTVRPPQGFGAPDYEQITATGEPSILPLGIVCRFVADDGSTAVATTPWGWTVLAAVGLVLVIASVVMLGMRGARASKVQL